MPRMIGRLLWLVVGIIVISVQIPKLKVENHSRLAALSQILFWVSLSTTSVVSVLVDKSTTPGKLILALSGLGCFTILIAAVVLAIIGLIQIHAHKDRHIAGRAAAVWTLCLSGLVLLIVGVTFVGQVRKGIANQSALVKSNGQPAYDAVDEVYRVEDIENNFRVELPGRGWSELEVGELNAQINFMAANPRINGFVMIIAEPVGAEDYDLKAIEQIIRSQAYSSQEVVWGNEFHDGDIGGRQLRRMEMDTSTAAERFEFQFTVFRENGMLNQVITYFNGKGSRERHKEITGKIVGSYATIDPEFAFQVDPSLRVERIASERTGIEVPLTESKWKLWHEMDSDLDYAEDGALIGQNAGLFLFGVRDIPPETEDASVNTVLTEILEFDSDSVANADKRQILVNGKPCWDYRLREQRSGQDYDFHVRLFREGTVAAAVTAWWTMVEKPSALEAAMDRIHFNPEVSVKIDELTAGQTQTQAQFLNKLGLKYYSDSRYLPAMDCFERAFRLKSTEAVYLRNALRAACHGELDESGITLARDQMTFVESDPTTRVLYAVLLAQSGEVAASVRQMNAALEAGFEDSDDMFLIVDTLVDQEAYEAAEEILHRALETQDSEKYAVWLATTLRLAKRFEDAERALAPFLKDKPVGLSVAEELVSIKIARGLPSEALEIANQTVQSHPDSPGAVDLKLDSLVELDWLTEARTTVEAALERFPDNPNLLEHREWLAGQLGLDELELVSTRLEPVALPEPLSGILEAAKQASHPSEWDKREVVYDYRTTGYFFEPGKPVRKTIRNRAHVKTRRAVESFSSLEFEFKRDSQHLYVNRVEVFNPEGKRIASANRDLFYLSEQSDSDMASDSTSLFVPVNGLSKDCYLEWEVTWENLSPSNAFPFTRTYLANTYPVSENLVYLTGSIDAVEVIDRKVRPVEAVTDGLSAWHVSKSMGVEIESSMPAYREILPVVELGSSQSSWPELAKSYLKDIESKLQPDQEIAAIVGDLNFEALNEEEKILKLVLFAQEHVVYKALEFGAKARIPDKASETWHNRYGDCKDLTILIYQLLLAADIESHPLLVHTSNPLVRELPSLDQFNHMVIYVPAWPDHGVIDLVDTTLDPRFGSPLDLGGRTGLLCDPEQPRLHTVDPYPSAWDKPSVEVHCEIVPDESRTELEVIERITLSGYYGSWMRSDYQNLEPKDYIKTVKDTLHYHLPDSAEIVSVDVSNVYDSSLPMMIQVRYTFSLEPAQFTFMPAWTDYYLEMQPDSFRQQPYRIRYPFSIHSVVQFGADFLIMEAWPEEADYAAANVLFERKAETPTSEDENGRRLGITSVRVGWEAADVPVDSYYAFFDSIEDIRTTNKLTLRLTEEGFGP